MAITIITGVPGTGKTAFVVSLLEEEAKKGRVIFVDNIPGLQVPHFRAGKIGDWQKGNWLHIDRYKRTAPAQVMSTNTEGDEDQDDNGNENWEPNPEVFYTDAGAAMVRVRDKDGQVVGVTDYQSHKGALLVIDECQRHFRPRPAGSPVPDHVAAFEVHRHQGLDIWLITQRVGLIDANVRGLCGRHIALRSTALGRYKYEWPECGDIDSKSSRDTAARTRYRLPKHVFSLYKSAEVHTKHGHSLPFVAKAMFLVVPLFFLFIYLSYSTISAKFNPKKPVHFDNPDMVQTQPAKHQPGIHLQNAKYDFPSEPPKVEDIQQPFDLNNFSIVARLQSATKDVYRFSVIENGQHGFYVSSSELQSVGYEVLPVGDCSVKLVYKKVDFFITCQARIQNPIEQTAQPEPIAPHFGEVVQPVQITGQ